MARKKKNSVIIERPSKQEVEKCLEEWKNLQNYVNQEAALDKLFKEDAVDNKDIRNVLLKVATLNAFYSTNIYSIYSVVERICEIENFDGRLASGDVSLVDELKKVTIKNKEKNFLSFASKYCSHHNQDAFPIYDYYVEVMLGYFRDCKDVNGKSFFKFYNKDIKGDYKKFCDVIVAFRDAYELDDFSLKEIDRYLWLTGKKYFPKDYGKSKETK